jgi:hypothetical protein
MNPRDRNRPMAALCVVIAVAIGLAACGSSDAGDSSTVPPAPTATQPASTDPTDTVAATTVPATTMPAVTTAVEVGSSGSAPVASTTEPAPTTAPIEAVVVTDAEVADLEQQLDEIDQLLAGIDADLSQD